MALGMSYHEFWESNPRIVSVYLESYKLKREIKDEEMWYLGKYFSDGVSIALGNAFRKKGAKAKDYFEVVKEPYLKKVVGESAVELSEKEKRQKTEIFFKNLEIQMANFNIKHGK